MDIRLHPSVLSADFVNMEAELHRIASADAVHVDVMDNHFVRSTDVWSPNGETHRGGFPSATRCSPHD